MRKSCEIVRVGIDFQVAVTRGKKKALWEIHFQIHGRKKGRRSGLRGSPVFPDAPAVLSYLSCVLGNIA